MQTPGATRMPNYARPVPIAALLAALAVAVVSGSRAFAGPPPQCPNSGNDCDVASGTLVINTSPNNYSGNTNVSSGATLDIVSGGALNGNGSLNNNGTLSIGTNGVGNFSGGGNIGTVAGSSSITVSGAGAQLTVSGANWVFGTVAGAVSTMTISNGASVTSAQDYLGETTGSTVNVTVTGAGSLWNENKSQIVGDTGTGSLTIANGAIVNVSNGVWIGNNANGVGSVLVTGAGSTYNVSNGLVVDVRNAGTLTVANGGTVNTTSGITVGLFSGGGTINIGAPAGQPAVAPGTINDYGLGIDFINTGSIVFNHTSSNYTFSPVLSGAGAVVVDAGTTIFPGANTYSGNTTINGGTLEVDGSIANSTTVTVNTGGTLTGIGTVDSVPGTTINSGGTLAPGNPGNLTGTLTIGGNLTFKTGANYLVTVSGANASSTTVGGTATLAGTVQAAFASAATAKSYDILHSAGLGNTTFGSVVAANYNATLSYTATDVSLNITGAALGNTSGLNQNQQAIANTISNFANDPPLPAIFASLFTLTGGALQNALGQLSGEDATGAERGAFEITTTFMNLMLDPFVDGRFGSKGFTGGGGQASGFAPEEDQFLPSDVALAYASVLGKAPPPATFVQRWTTWGTAYGGGNFSNGNAAIGSSNVTTTTFGFAGGADYHFSPDTIFGLALGGGGLNWGLAGGLGSGRSDNFQAGVYGITRFGPAYLAGSLAFGNQWMTTNRVALGDQITASFVGQSYGARLEGGYRFAAMPMLGVTPYGAVQAQDFHTPGYSETDLTGGGLGLTFASMNATDVRTEIGTRLDSPTAFAGMPLILRGRVAWAHDFVSNPALNAAFQALPGTSFTVNGARIPNDSALASAGAELFLTARLSLLLKFDGEFAPGSQTYAGTGTLRYTW